ncbi:relaxase/mobilization nuclease domain-containing protein [Christensenellaceae bacterium OttesenSCG-928-K19]|nr:relaxase/mobilization nuclease domain-containing protein [Christensenellaceae bacterium OttesenSCG-928-K19]
MATTRIIPLHIGKGRSLAKALKDIADYMENPLKTEDGELISFYECVPETVESEFFLSKSRYAFITKRDQGEHDVIAYQVRQSFKPGEIMPEEANRIGYELAMRFTKGRHAFIVYTHTDRRHIHSHVVWNSTRLDYQGKFRNFLGSAFAVRRLSDHLCVEHGLSVIKEPKPSRGNNYGKWLGDDKPLSHKKQLIMAVDTALDQKPATFEDFLSLMRAAGYTINTKRKHITFLAPGWDKPTRMDTLREEYTEEAVRDRIAGRHVFSSGGREPAAAPTVSRPSLLIDIQSKIQQGKGAGYERWARVFNLKQAAQTLLYLQQHGLDSYDALQDKTSATTARFHDLSEKTKSLELELKANADLQKHIVNYSKTRDTYAAYRRSGNPKQFRAEHETDIILHEAAKKAFDDLGYGRDNKLPTVKMLRAAYAPVLEEKKKANAEYRQAKAEMRELLLAKENVDRLLGTTSRDREAEPERTDL